MKSKYPTTQNKNDLDSAVNRQLLQPKSGLKIISEKETPKDSRIFVSSNYEIK